MSVDPTPVNLTPVLAIMAVGTAILSAAYTYIIIGQRRELARERDHRRRVSDALAVAQRDLKEHEQSFDLRWRASRRATKRWQQAHPERTDVWPDHADLCVWLLEQLASREAAVVDATALAAEAQADARLFNDEFLDAHLTRLRLTREIAEARDVLINSLALDTVDVDLGDRSYRGPVEHTPLVIAAVAVADRLVPRAAAVEVASSGQYLLGPHMHKTVAYDESVHCYTCNVTRHGADAVALWKRTPPHLRSVIVGPEPGA